MKTARLQSKLLVAAMAAVIVLPYTAPTVCVAFGLMGDEMEMRADAGTGTVRAPESGEMCCTLNECGVPQVGPVAYAVNVLRQVATVRVELPARQSAHSANALLPPIPPPKPSLLRSSVSTHGAYCGV